MIYAVDVTAFRDSNGDGLGDLAGVRDRLHHLVDLGVGCLWVQPFYRSPRRDGGYDVVDHRAVDLRLGTDADFDGLVADAHGAGLRVLVDLVASHTSDRHAWFQASRSGDSEFADFYVWRHEPDRSLGVEQIFPGVEGDVWTFDERRGEWYLHRFYAHEPDLNIANEAVRAEIFGIVRHWLERGVDGFRVDAAPYLAQKASWADPTDAGHWFLRDLRRHTDAINPEAVLIAEADVATTAYDAFLADGAGVHLVFNFHANNHLFLSLARRNGEPLGRSVRELAAAGASCGFVNWVRNHDELDLERLSEIERAEVYAAFAPGDEARVYGRGIRRRLPPMVGGDRALIELATSAVFSLPGTPVLRYGDEIGMGDDLAQPERLAVRTAMQWSAGPNGGFSEAVEVQTPIVTSGPFSADQVNVADQRNDTTSLLSWTRTLIAVRSACPEIARVAPHLITDIPSGVLAFRYETPSRTLIVAHNFGTDTMTVDFDPFAPLIQLFPRATSVTGSITLAPAASVWLATAP